MLLLTLVLVSLASAPASDRVPTLPVQLTAPLAVVQDDEFEEVVDDYERKRGRPPLRLKCEGWEALTKNGDSRVFEYLQDDYKRPPMAPEFARSCMLALASRDLGAKLFIVE